MPTFLVVDDSAVDRRFIGELLQKKTVCSVEYAANGAEALARLQDAAVDLVVTDLSMPIKDGLELTREVRSHRPDVPVILMTAHGSETLAIEALKQGAASYVPKSHAAEWLADTIEEVLARARAERGQEQLIQCLEGAEFTFSLENEPTMIEPLVDLVQQLVAGMSFGDFFGRMQIGIALKQALLNAIFHGNLELGMQPTTEEEDSLIQESDLSTAAKRALQPPYRDRRVHVHVKIAPAEARFVIRDQGAGFDVGSVPASGDPSALDPQRGRGLSLMHAFMDEVVFNESGNEVTMIKRAIDGEDVLSG